MTHHPDQSATALAAAPDVPIPAQSRRFVDPDHLVCPGCGERVAGEPPAYWRVADGLPVPQFSHGDRSALCRDARGAVAGPVETETGVETDDAIGGAA